MYRHKTKKYRAAAVGAVLAAVLMLGFAGCDKLPTSSDSAATAAPTPTPEPEDLTVFAEGTTMDGIDISGMKLAEAEKVCRAAALKPYANINVTVKSGDTEMTAKGSELTVVDTLDITLTRLLKSRKAGDYEMTYCLTLKNFENELKQKLGDFVVQAKDATVGSYDFDAGDFMFEDAVNGKKLDVYGTLAAVKAQFLKKTSGEVEAALQETAAKVTVDDLRKDFGMISSFETVSTNTENGNHNMGLALSRVNGTVLNPGDTFSYENIVGDSTNASTGFLPAGGLSGGALVQMYGGGICQASSTIYGAALRAGMTITLRDCHSSPSTYVPIGLDATVSYGEIDKKAAKEALQRHYKGKKLLPKIFKKENHIDEIKGVYVPFWLFDADADADIRYKATRVRTWSDSDYDYTETSYYSIGRSGDIGFDRVPVDGSSKMPDDLMESIEPF